MKEEKFVRMNIALADFMQGQQWAYSKAPAVVKMWFEKKAILFETKICSLVTKNGESLSKQTKTLAEINQDKMDESQKLEQEKSPKLIKPKNRKKPGRTKGSGKVKKPRKKVTTPSAKADGLYGYTETL